MHPCISAVGVKQHESELSRIIGTAGTGEPRSITHTVAHMLRMKLMKMNAVMACS